MTLLELLILWMVVFMASVAFSMVSCMFWYWWKWFRWLVQCACRRCLFHVWMLMCVMVAKMGMALSCLIRLADERMIFSILSWIWLDDSVIMISWYMWRRWEMRKHFIFLVVRSGRPVMNYVDGFMRWYVGWSDDFYGPVCDIFCFPPRCDMELGCLVTLQGGQFSPSTSCHDEDHSWRSWSSIKENNHNNNFFVSMCRPSHALVRVVES